MEITPYPISEIATNEPDGTQGPISPQDELLSGRTQPVYLPFLQFLFDPEDTIELRPIRDAYSAGRRRTQTLWKYRTYCTPGQYIGDSWIYVNEQLEKPISVQIAMSAENYANLYFGVCPRVGKQWFNKAWQIRKINFLWADIDDISTADALERVHVAGIPEPSAVVNSGHGVHLYWRLKKPVIIDQPPPLPVKSERFRVDDQMKTISVLIDEKGEKVEYGPGIAPPLHETALLIQDINAGIAELIGGDHTKDLARLLRIPGALNRKGEEQGVQPVPCELVRLDIDRLYELEVFQSYAESSPSRKERLTRSKIPLKKPIAKLGTRAESTLQQLTTECAVAEPPFRSTRDFHLCAKAIEEGWEREMVWSSVANMGKFGERGRSYFDATWAKAEDSVRQAITQHTRAQMQNRDEIQELNKSSLDPSPNGHNDTRVEKQISDLLQMDILGWGSDTGCRVFARATRRLCDIKDVARLSREHCLAIFGHPAKRHIARNADEVSPTRFPMGDVRDAISLLASKACANTEHQIGSGVWRGIDDLGKATDEVLIVSGSEAAVWDGVCERLEKLQHPRYGGRTILFGESQPWCDFEKLEEYLRASLDQKWSDAVMKECIEIFDRWVWKKKMSSELTLGLVMSSWIQTLWPWRPMISITGESRAGKTTLMSRTIAPMFNGLALSSSDATAAGIRQAIACNATVVILDEFDVEAGDRYKAAENRKIQKMFRMSGKGDSHFRGTPGQRAIAGRMQHIPWFGGIVFQSVDEADTNRFLNLYLKRPSYKIPESPESNLKDLGLRLLAISVRHAIPAIKTAEMLEMESETYARKYKDATDLKVRGRYRHLASVHSRIVQGYSAPAAIMAHASRSNSTKLLETLLWHTVDMDENEIEQDYMSTLDAIATAKIALVGGRKLTVAHILRELAPYEGIGDQVPATTAEELMLDEYRTALESNGLKLGTYEHRELAMAAAAREEEDPEFDWQVLEKTGCLLIGWKTALNSLVPQYGRQRIDQSLMRAPIAIRSRRRIGKGSNQRVVMLPFLWFYDKLMSDANEADRPYYLKGFTAEDDLRLGRKYVYDIRDDDEGPIDSEGAD